MHRARLCALLFGCTYSSSISSSPGSHIDIICCASLSRHNSALTSFCCARRCRAGYLGDVFSSPCLVRLRAGRHHGCAGSTCATSPGPHPQRCAVCVPRGRSPDDLGLLGLAALGKDWDIYHCTRPHATVLSSLSTSYPCRKPWVRCLCLRRLPTACLDSIVSIAGLSTAGIAVAWCLAMLLPVPGNTCHIYSMWRRQCGLFVAWCTALLRSNAQTTAAALPLLQQLVECNPGLPSTPLNMAAILYPDPCVLLTSLPLRVYHHTCTAPQLRLQTLSSSSFSQVTSCPSSAFLFNYATKCAANAIHYPAGVEDGFETIVTNTVACLRSHCGKSDAPLQELLAAFLVLLLKKRPQTASIAVGCRTLELLPDLAATFPRTVHHYLSIMALLAPLPAADEWFRTAKAGLLFQVQSLCNQEVARDRGQVACCISCLRITLERLHLAVEGSAKNPNDAPSPTAMALELLRASSLLQQLVYVCTVHVKDPEIVWQTAYCLVSIVAASSPLHAATGAGNSTGGTDVIMLNDGPAAFLQCAKDHPDHLLLCQWVCSLLLYLSDDPNHASALLEAGLPNTILTALQYHPAQPGVVTRPLLCFVRRLADTFKQLGLGSELVTALVRSMSTPWPILEDEEDGADSLGPEESLLAHLEALLPLLRDSDAGQAIVRNSNPLRWDEVPADCAPALILSLIQVIDNTIHAPDAPEELPLSRPGSALRPASSSLRNSTLSFRPGSSSLRPGSSSLGRPGSARSGSTLRTTSSLAATGSLAEDYKALSTCLAGLVVLAAPSAHHSIVYTERLLELLASVLRRPYTTAPLLMQCLSLLSVGLPYLEKQTLFDAKQAIRTSNVSKLCSNYFRTHYKFPKVLLLAAALFSLSMVTFP